MTYAEVVYMAFSNGPKSLQKYATFNRYVVTFGLFIAYFGTCSVYSALIGENIKQVMIDPIELLTVRNATN